MPFSFDAQPGENETECGRCGAHIYIELTRCPECGINLFEPEDDLTGNYGNSVQGGGLFDKVGVFFRAKLGKPFSAEEVFGQFLDQSKLYKDLLAKVGGDENVVERLIQFERQYQPDGSRITWLKNAIQRWEGDNRANRSGDYR